MIEKLKSLKDFKTKNIYKYNEINYEDFNTIFVLYIKNTDLPYSSILIDSKGNHFHSIDSVNKDECILNSYSQYLKKNENKLILDNNIVDEANQTNNDCLDNLKF